MNDEVSYVVGYISGVLEQMIREGLIIELGEEGWNECCANEIESVISQSKQ